MKHTKKLLSLLLVLCLVLSLVCAWMISRYLSKPVKELDEAMGRVEKGDYEVELISDRSDEMGRLSSSFNRMTREYRQNLERSVQHERELNETEKPTFTLLDFHAQATSEKLALGYYLDGRISAMWGTHTHVPTADERVMPKGTGYITDLGMTGAIESVLGIPPEQSIESFLGGLAGRYRFADGPCKAQGCIFTLDSDTGLCTAVERVDIR